MMASISLPPREAGFTLIEMLVVVLIIAATSALVFQFQPRANRTHLELQARLVQVFLTNAALHAREKNIVVRVLVDVEGRQLSYGPAQNEEISLPEDIAIWLRTGRELAQSNERGELHFGPRGGSSGGEIGLRDQAGTACVVSINWLTGGIRIVALKEANAAQ